MSVLSLQLTLLRVGDPDLLARLDAVQDPSGDPTAAAAVLRLLALEDEDDDRFDALFKVAVLTDPDGKARASVGRLVPTPTATTVADDGTPTVHYTRVFDGWSVDATETGDRPDDAMQLHVVVATTSRQAEPLQLDWTGTVGTGRSLLRPMGDLLLVVTTAPTAGLTEAVADRAAERERVAERLSDYDLRRHRERRRALEELLGDGGGEL